MELTYGTHPGEDIEMTSFLSTIIILFIRFITAPLGAERKLRTFRKTLVPLRKLILTLYKPGSPTFRLSGDFEADTREWLDSISVDCATMLWDIGANVGAYSLYAALQRNMQVLAFEPQAASYALLNETIERVGIDSRIVAYQIAFDSNTKLGRLNQEDTGFGAGMHGFNTEKDQFEHPIATKFRQGAIGFSVDDFVQQFSPPLPTHVKIDVDGLELSILEGGAKTFSAPSVRSMIVELQGSDERQAGIVRLMAELGFTAEPKASPSYRNMIFRRMD